MMEYEAPLTVDNAPSDLVLDAALDGKSLEDVRLAAALDDLVGKVKRNGTPTNGWGNYTPWNDAPPVPPASPAG